VRAHHRNQTKKKGTKGRTRYNETQKHNGFQESLVTQEKNIVNVSKVEAFDNNNNVGGQGWKGGYAIYVEQRERGI